MKAIEAQFGRGRSVIRQIWRALDKKSAAACALLLVGLTALTLYEAAVLGWPVAREEPARFDAYHLLRSALSALGSIAFLTAAAKFRWNSDQCLQEGVLSSRDRIAALALMVAALAAVGLLDVDPNDFHAFAREDSLLEWLSAILILAASAIFAMQAVSALRHRPRPGEEGLLRLLLPACLAVLFFVIGMEEISWLQRVIGFETPGELADINWQGEFNLHNVQTDLSEAVYYTGSALFLILLPFLRPFVPSAWALHPIVKLMPRRSVAAVSAPLSIFNYGQWNLLPIQMTFFLTLGVLLAFAGSAARRGSPREATLFIALAAAVAVGQLLVLLDGPSMADIPDATEFKELFIAVGFFWYALTVTRGKAAAAFEDAPAPQAS